MRDVEADAHAVVVGNAHLSQVRAPEDAHARFTVALPGRFLTDSRAIEKALHIRKVRDEFLVVAFLETFRFRSEFVDEFLPGIRRFDPLERFPVPLHLFVWTQRHELNRPDDDLAKVSNPGLATHVDLLYAMKEAQEVWVTPRASPCRKIRNRSGTLSERGACESGYSSAADFDQLNGAGAPELTPPPRPIS